MRNMVPMECCNGHYAHEDKIYSIYIDDYIRLNNYKYHVHRKGSIEYMALTPREVKAYYDRMKMDLPVVEEISA